MQNKLYVTYEDFGAVGDGKADDFSAIVRAHEYATEMNLPVRARDGAKYYISGKDLTAKITTDTDFGTAEFIIDDTTPENVMANVFEVVSLYEAFNPALTSLSKDETVIDTGCGYPLFIRVFNENQRIFIRMGLNANGGVEASDCITVDECGRVTSSIDRDYPTITSCYAKRIDDKPITVRGGIFTTIANRYACESNYHYRGIYVYRANVTLLDITHYVIGEGETGAPYNHFIGGEDAVNLTLKNCLLTPHKVYTRPSDSDPTKTISMGTYDINFLACVNVTLDGVTQTRDIHNPVYWGLMGSNFCKNMIIKNCSMSRFDAHMGVSGVRITDCEFGHQRVSLIGYGDAYLENVRATGFSFIYLRRDYGSFWCGSLTIKNCVWKIEATPKEKELVIFYALNRGTHDFGYECAMPSSIVIDGLQIIDTDESAIGKPLFVLPDYDPQYAEGKPFAYRTPSNLILKNITVESGRELKLCSKPEQYPGITVKEA